MRLFPAAVFPPPFLPQRSLVQRDLVSSISLAGKPGTRSASIAFEQLVAWRKSDREVRRSRNDSEENDRTGWRGGRGEGDRGSIGGLVRDPRAEDRSNGLMRPGPITTISPILRIHRRSPGRSPCRPIIFAPLSFFFSRFFSSDGPAILKYSEIWSI